MEIFYYWIAASIVFLIIEMLTTTFYGLSLSLAAIVTAIYAFFVPSHGFTIMQTVIFLGITTLLVFTLPAYISKKIPNKRQGMDVYIDKVVKVKKIGDVSKITLDGVNYAVEGERLNEGDSVKIVNFSDSVFHVIKN